MSAWISPCGLYRYELTRPLDTGAGRVLWVMLNPSTADADLDDSTICKCIGFTERWGFAKLVVVNLFAFRATDPAELRQIADPIGPDNLVALQAQLFRYDRVVLAWGANAKRLRRDPKIDAHVRYVEGLYPDAACLGFNRDGSPKHPLYIKYETAPAPFQKGA